MLGVRYSTRILATRSGQNPEVVKELEVWEELSLYSERPSAGAEVVTEATFVDA